MKTDISLINFLQSIILNKVTKDLQPFLEVGSYCIKFLQNYNNLLCDIESEQ